MVKPVRVRFVVEPSSLKELEKLFDKFKLNWDDKVFKKVDNLSDSLDKLQKVMHDIWRQNAYGTYQKVKGGGTGGATGGNKDLQAILQQVTKEFDKSTKTLTTSIEKTTKAIGGLALGTGKATATMMSYEEKMDLLDKSTQKELLAIEARERWHMKIKEKQMEISKFEEKGRKERQASRGWMNMLGGSGSFGGQLSKIVEPFIKDAFKPMQQVFELKEFQKTPEGIQAEKLKYNTSPAFPMARLAGQAAYQKAGIDDPDKARAGGSGVFGRARSWLGGRAKAHEEGGMMGMMGGKKGIALAGGALLGIGLLKKGISLGIESSPMMQQMLKLWKFGIMMVFRPIGDFFGFFLRPIFIMLLRKFIIPFYQEYLPLMQTMGMDIGDKVAGILSAIFNALPWGKTAYTNDTKYSSLDINTATGVTDESIAELVASAGKIEEAVVDVPLKRQTGAGIGEDGSDPLGAAGVIAQTIYDNTIGQSNPNKEQTIHPWEQDMTTGTEGRVNPRDDIQAELDRVSSDIKIAEAENQIQRGDIIIAPIINVEGGGDIDPEPLEDRIIDTVIKEVTRGMGRYQR